MMEYLYQTIFVIVLPILAFFFTIMFIIVVGGFILKWLVKKLD